MQAARARRWLRSLAFLLGTLSAPAALRADYKDSYRKGLELAERGNWPDAARRMREALAEQAREGESIKIYGMRFEPYLPHYYLGLALYNTGDCSGALDAWRASEEQAAVRKSGEYKTLLKHKAACETRLAETRPKASPTADPALAAARQAAEAAVIRAESAWRSVTALSREAELAAAWQKDAALGGRERQAAELLASARSRLDAGKRKPDAGVFTEVRELARRAADQFEALTREASTRRDALRQADEAAKARKAAEETSRVADQKAVPARPAAPPAELLRAARAYFGGEYQQAADALARVDYRTGPAAVQALLFRAASRHALYLTGGENDGELKRLAVADVQACRRLDPAFRPDRRAFSPRFREFFGAAN